MDVPLEEDFECTLSLVRKLRKNVRRDPILPTEKGGAQTNPAYVLLKDQELHLRGLARIMGPHNVEDAIRGEFRSSLSFVRVLMDGVLDAPVAEGQRHAQTRNPLAVILSCEQTHVRGCSALLITAGSVVPPESEGAYGSLFTEPASDAT